MERVNRILNHPVFVESMGQNATSEAGRTFCKHDMAHALDVARIAYIQNLERGLGFSKELIYAAALLHDITKWQQHLEDVPHHESAIEPATAILQDADFSEAEIAAICRAILHHRDGSAENDPFSALIFRADKLSRPCYTCESAEACKWSLDQKNTALSD